MTSVSPNKESSSSSINNSMLSTARTDDKGLGQGPGLGSGYLTPTPTPGSSSHGAAPGSVSSTSSRGGGVFSHLLTPTAAAGSMTPPPGPLSSTRGANPPNTLNPLNNQSNNQLNGSSTASRDDGHMGQGQGQGTSVPAAVRPEEIYEVRADRMQSHSSYPIYSPTHLLTHPCSIPLKIPYLSYLNTSSTPLLNTTSQHTLCTCSINTPFQHTLSTGACRWHAGVSSSHLRHVRTVGANHASKRGQTCGQRNTRVGVEAP